MLPLFLTLVDEKGVEPNLFTFYCLLKIIQRYLVDILSAVEQKKNTNKQNFSCWCERIQRAITINQFFLLLISVIVLCAGLTSIMFYVDIDQLTRILLLCGTPSQETLNKITSEEVRYWQGDPLEWPWSYCKNIGRDFYTIFCMNLHVLAKWDLFIKDLRHFNQNSLCTQLKTAILVACELQRPQLDL